MGHQNTSFSQLQRQFDRHEFGALAQKHFKANSGRRLTHWGHFSFWMFALLTKAKSLRFAVEQLNAMPEKLYHMGFKSVKLSTISEANSKRSYEFYRSLFFVIFYRLKKSLPRTVQKAIRVLDSTTITFSDTRFKWAKFRSSKKGIKVHVLFDQQNEIPRNLKITNANRSDVKLAHQFSFLKGIICVFDRAYTDFKLWRKIHENKAFFVIRAKTNLLLTTLKSEIIHDVPGVLEKQTVALLGDVKGEFGEHLFLFRLVDIKTQKEIKVITNNPKLSAEEVSDIYRKRWSIEIFFKWLKQNIQVKRMYGISENAVKLQIWLAMILYILLWQMHHVTVRTKTKFTEFLRAFQARIVLSIQPRKPVVGQSPPKTNPQQARFEFSAEP
ncbi:MAG: IS4 family transposase [Leptospiraceae bacterium]|jgi:IS4 transposase|nr:IS4 family transposase [Leptospiraceae bacterium]